MERANQAAERVTLASAMMWPKVIDDLPVVPEDFAEPRHEDLYRLIVEEARKGEPTDAIALGSKVDRINGVDAVWLTQLALEAPGAPQLAASYARTVAGLSRGRAVRSVAARLEAGVDNEPWDGIDTLLDGVRAELDGVVAKTSGVRVRKFADVLKDAAERWSKPQERRAWPTGWQELDDMLNGGWKPGQVTVLGARPAVGKSAVAACATVAAHTYGAGFFSLEMSEAELAGRMVAIEKAVELERIEKAQLNNRDWEKITSLLQEAQNWRVWLETKPRRSMSQIRATVRSWAREGHIPLIVIDYLQLMSPADMKETRERQVSRLAEDCKALAKDFDCHVLALAQVNRGSTMREDKRPTMGDLRESGGIEANADNIILLHRDDNPDDVMGASSIEFNVVKNRHGRTGVLDLAWRPNYSSANSEGNLPGSYRFGLA
ncbi:replicative DNA helicase [Kocuria massiliensis]|uniref:replicative DNA helicase n=1 Tax=Kocuria massiliensis TaxID=1926282 RepID=UPI0022B9C753|nr:DnaB-like helicase C-terminal domain-containing protein [Kocuria massiliensis]